MKRARKHLTVQDVEEINKLIGEWNVIAADRRRQTFKVMMTKLVGITEKYEEFDALLSRDKAARPDRGSRGNRDAGQGTTTGASP